MTANGQTNWCRSQLDGLAERIDYGFTESAVMEPVGPKFLRITDIQRGAVDWNSVPYCQASDENLDDYRLKPGDIVFARTGATTGKSFLIRECPDNAIFASYLIRVRPKLSVEPTYLAHFFNTPDYWAQIRQQTVGSGQPGVNSTRLRTLTVPVPPRAEQQRIAAILDKADAIRRKRRDAINAATQFPVSIFHHCFTFSTDDPEAFRPLNSVAQVVSGVTKGRRFNGATTRSVPYLRVANVQDGYLDLAEIKTIEALPDEISALALKPGDVVMTEGGDYDKLGRGALWESAIPECIHQNHVFRVRLDENQVLPEFFATYLRTSAAKAYFLRCAKKTTNLASINSTQLKNLPVPSVPIDDQKCFVSLLKKQGSLMERFNSQAEYADDLFNSLVQRAFRGDL